MKDKKIIDLLKSAYRWGVDNGSNRSEKNFNDFLQTSLIRELLEAQPEDVKTEVNVLSDLSEDDKKSTIDQFVRITAKATLELFLMLGLKTHIECMVKNEPTNQEFIFSFKTVEYASQSQPKPTDEEIENAAENYLQSLGHFRYTKEAKHDFIMGAKAVRGNLQISKK